jgi:hypothetical protein
MDATIVNAMHNQLLANLDSMLNDIERIAEDGPCNQRDEDITKKCMLFVAGYLHKRRAEAAETP